MNTKSNKKEECEHEATTHAPEALNTILTIMRKDGHKDQLRAAQEVLNRAYGPIDKQSPPELKIVERFLNNELNASDAALMIESHGKKVPLRISGQAIREDSRQRNRPKR